MDFAVGNPYLETAACVLLTLVLGAAIFFWGRGIRNARKSDLIAGPTTLVALCLILFVISGSSAVFGLIGGLVAVFGIATLLLSALARPGSPFPRRNVIAVGVGAVIAGVCLSLII